MENVITSAIQNSVYHMGFWGFIISSAIYAITLLVDVPVTPRSHKEILRFSTTVALLNLLALILFLCIFKTNLLMNVGFSIAYSGIFFMGLRSYTTVYAKHQAAMFA